MKMLHAMGLSELPIAPDFMRINVSLETEICRGEYKRDQFHEVVRPTSEYVA